MSSRQKHLDTNDKLEDKMSTKYTVKHQKCVTEDEKEQREPSKVQLTVLPHHYYEYQADCKITPAALDM